MKFYAFKLDNEAFGCVPLGTDGKMLFELKTIKGAIDRSKKQLKTNFILQTYTNFYDDDSFKTVYDCSL